MVDIALTPEQEFHYSTTPLADMDPHSLYRWTIERLLDPNSSPQLIDPTIEEFHLVNSLSGEGKSRTLLTECRFRYRIVVHRARWFVYTAYVSATLSRSYRQPLATTIVSVEDLVTFADRPRDNEEPRLFPRAIDAKCIAESHLPALLKRVQYYISTN